MQIESHECGKYQVLKVQDKEHGIKDLSGLEDEIRYFLDNGKKFIAISFSAATYIYSGAIQVLVNSHKLISQNGGELSVVEPNPSLFGILEDLNIGRVINIYVSEKYLPQ